MRGMANPNTKGLYDKYRKKWARIFNKFLAEKNSKLVDRWSILSLLRTLSIKCKARLPGKYALSGFILFSASILKLISMQVFGNLTVLLLLPTPR